MTTTTENTLTIDERTYTLHAASGFYVRAWEANTHATVWAAQAADALTHTVSTVCLKRDPDSAIAQAIALLERKIANGGVLAPDEDSDDEDDTDDGGYEIDDDEDDEDSESLYEDRYSTYEQYQRDFQQDQFLSDHYCTGGVTL